jgi:hypothetical protein
MAAELCRAAVLDRRHHLELLKADMAGCGAVWLEPKSLSLRNAALGKSLLS